MTLLHRLASIVRWVVRRTYTEREMDDELRAFVDMSVSEKMRAGVPAAVARRQALLELGGLEQVKEHVRTDRHGGSLDSIARDVRYACRIFRKQPGFTSVVVLTLALGIGANTAIFSLIDALMLRPLPVRDPQELVQLNQRGPGATGTDASFSYPIVRAFAEHKDVFAGLAGYSGSQFRVAAHGSTARVSGAVVTGAFYETLGLTPATGRLLEPPDDELGAPLVAVISDGYWERQFARDPRVPGQTLEVNGQAVTIVGVSPEGFVGANVGQVADLTLPVAAIPRVDPGAARLLGPGNFWLRVLARPRPGISVSEAQARLAVIWSQIADTVIAPHWPASRRQEMAATTFELSSGSTGWTFLRKIYETPLVILMAVVTLVLLIACANVAGLMLARSSARQREVAVRLAIGAGRARIVRQLLIESSLLAVTGALFGVGLAWFSGRWLIDIISTGPVEVVFDLTPNGHVLGFTSTVAIATSVLFGIAPALHTTAAGPSLVLKEEARIVSPRSRMLPALVSAQVALALVLLIGAGLFLKTLLNLQESDPGFNARGVLVADFEGRRSALPQDVVDEIRRVPGVVSASVSTHTPMSGSSWSEPAVPAGQPIPERDTALFVGAGPGFFQTMGTPILAGREFSERDSIDGPGVAVVNQRFADRFFANVNPLGRHLAARVRDQVRDLEIVGVVRNVHAARVRAAPASTVYVSYAQLSGNLPTTMEIRTTGPIAPLTASVRQILQSRLPATTIEIRPLAMQVGASVVQERMLATLVGGFGVLALTLACVGLYGLLAYSVARRTREIGIRMALGAQRQRVIAQVLKNAAWLVVIGMAIGLPAAWAGARWIKSMLFGLTPTDPLVIGAAVVLLMMAAQLAAYLPARRASLVDPLTALRHE